MAGWPGQPGIINYMPIPEKQFLSTGRKEKDSYTGGNPGIRNTSEHFGTRICPEEGLPSFAKLSSTKTFFH